MIIQYFCILYVIINISFVLTDTKTSVGTKPPIEKPENKTNSTVSTSYIITEGGKINLTQNFSQSVSSTRPTSTVENNNTVSSTTVLTETTDVKPVTESDPHEDSRIKPRKGVSLNDMLAENSNYSTPSINIPSSTSTITTTPKLTTTVLPTTTPIPRKPTVTYGSDEDDSSPRLSKSRVFIGGKEVGPNNRSSPGSPTIAVGDQIIVGIRNRHSKGSDYVLPIVLTILAVPLVAIIFTVVYKRGAEWWSHRHYRRMDFLIEGMYNN